MTEEKKRGLIKGFFFYMVSPRLFMKSKDIKNHGMFSFIYHVKLYSAIKHSWTLLRSKGQKVTVDISNRTERLKVFYDRMYECGVENADEVSEKHREHLVGYKVSMVLFMAIATLSIVFIKIPDFIIIPSWVIGACTLICSLSFLMKSLIFMYYAWLLENRLTPEHFSVIDYIKHGHKESFAALFPHSDISENMKIEIAAEIQKREKYIIEEMLKDPTLDPSEYGLRIPKGAPTR